MINKKAIVLKAKKEINITSDIKLEKGQEVEIVMDVVYVNGNLLPPAFQNLFMTFINNNHNLFDNITRNW